MRLLLQLFFISDFCKLNITYFSGHVLTNVSFTSLAMKKYFNLMQSNLFLFVLFLPIDHTIENTFHIQILDYSA